MDHPLILHKISMLRSKETGTKDFRELIYEIALLIGYEATRDLPVTEYTVSTPVAEAVGYRLPRQVCLVPILRAGLGMVDALLSLIPAARVGHIGLYRDPQTLEPVEYYCKMPPDLAERVVPVLDPMLATGGERRRGHLVPEAAWREIDQDAEHHRFSRGREEGHGRTPRRRHLPGQPGRETERSRLHRARLGRRRRPSLRDTLSSAGIGRTLLF